MLNSIGGSARALALGVALIAGCAAGPSAAQAAPAQGSAVFAANCSMCHQLGATGVPGQFPRLAGRASRIAATAAGRGYLEHVVLYGMMGTITVDGQSIVGGVMPPFASLSDDDLAAALDYIISLDDSGKVSGKGAAITTAEIARVRAGKTFSPIEVHQLRAKVVGRKPS